MTADLGPAATPRPIPTPGDRMTAARQPGPTFATYLDRHDRDQARAEAANLRQQLDRANTDRQRLQEQLDDMATQRNMAHTAAAIARTDVHHDIARQIDILAADPGILRDWLTTCDPQPTGFGELFHALAEKLRRADAPGLGSPADRAQDEPAELPAWVLELVRGLDRYEAEHPTLYRYMGVNQYEPWPCPAPLLGLVPVEVRRQAGIEG